MIWMGISLIGAVGVGIFGRAYAERNGVSVEDSETIFILLADMLFLPLVTGFLFAALLAAVMSTVSSQLLVSSSSLTEDFYRLFLRKEAGEGEIVTVGRVAVVAVGVVAAFIAADPESQVLGLVANAWAGFGAAFGPLIILSLTWRRMTGAGAVAGLVTGAATVIALDLARLERRVPRRTRDLRDHPRLRRGLRRHRRGQPDGSGAGRVPRGPRRVTGPRP